MTATLYLFVCGAGPAAEVGELARLARSVGWDVFVGATPAGWEFLDVGGLAAATGHEPRHTWSGRANGWPHADAVVVAPATLNTVGKIAAGIADTWAVNTIVECLGLGVPIVVAPNVNPALGRHPGYRRNVEELRSWGVTVLWEPDGADPPVWMVSWDRIVEALPPVGWPDARREGL